jgi:predicted metal-dependent phosphoesterase TrpH
MRAGIREAALDTLAMDGLEVFNAATAMPVQNERALHYARTRGLPMTAGSDAHHHASIGRSHTVFHAERLNVPSILQSLRAGTTLHCRPLRLRESLRKTFHTWFRHGPFRVQPPRITSSPA